MVSISNELLNIEVDLKGAELQSIYHKVHKLEYMWSGDSRFWGKKSPVLFPIVGTLRNNSYLYNGRAFSLDRHGFARNLDFSVKSQTTASVVLALKENEQTLANYPFLFNFSIEYVLAANTVSITYRVENTGDQELLFSVGGHPAFKVPLLEGTAYEDYYLLFEKQENASHFPISKEGLIELLPVPFLKNTDHLQLKRDLFYNDALVFKDLKSETISLLSKGTTHGLRVSFAGFPYMGIWAAKNADFVCIEPWCGIADSVNSSGQLKEKEGIQVLNAGEVFLRTFSITTLPDMMGGSV